MITSLHSNDSYTSKIYVTSTGFLLAEIIKTTYFAREELQFTALHKYFSQWFKKEPAEQDWINANLWVDKHLSLISKYGKITVFTPNCNKGIK